MRATTGARCAPRREAGRCLWSSLGRSRDRRLPLLRRAARPRSHDAAPPDEQQPVPREHRGAPRPAAGMGGELPFDLHAPLRARRRRGRAAGRRRDEAMSFYETAIHAARDDGFVQTEGVAYELAARFYRARGFATFADAYLREARTRYLRWGADGKVRQLEQRFPRSSSSRRSRPAPRSRSNPSSSICSRWSRRRRPSRARSSSTSWCARCSKW